MKDLLDRFAEIDSNKDGLVDLEEFAEYLNLPVTRQVKHLFSLYDRVSITLEVYTINHNSSFNPEDRAVSAGSVVQRWSVHCLLFC